MKKDALKIGTLIDDNGKIGVISNVIEMGELDPKIPIISWRANYEITYTDGTKLILSCYALEQMLINEKIKIYHTGTPPPHYPTTPLSSSSPSIPDSVGKEDNKNGKNNNK